MVRNNWNLLMTVRNFVSSRYISVFEIIITKLDEKIQETFLASRASVNNGPLGIQLSPTLVVVDLVDTTPSIFRRNHTNTGPRRRAPVKKKKNDAFPATPSIVSSVFNHCRWWRSDMPHRHLVNLIPSPNNGTSFPVRNGRTHIVGISQRIERNWVIFLYGTDISL